MSSNKKLFIKSYGCQMNAYDSDRMADVLAPHGYDVAAGPEDADIVILNTCHIREKAAEKVFSELGRLRPMQARKAAAGGRMMVAVAGCVAQAEGEEIARRAPYVDIVVGPQTYHRLPELVARAERLGGSTVVDTDFPVESKFDLLPQPRRSGVTAFLSIQEGCDRFCTFCVVPYTRGAEYSRAVEAVVAEAEALVGAGVREITLLGQNVNAYHGAAPGGSTGEWSLARLIERLAEIEGLERIRYTTSHPHDMSDDLIAVHGAVDKLMPYLHLPVQAGSDRILAAMNRRYTADSYRRLVDRLRRAHPDLALSSDFIVGFPGETDGDFAATLRVVTDIGFAQAFSFMYSPRPGTPAAAMEAQVPEPVRSERLAMLQELLGAQQQAFNARCVGETLPVLVEKRGRYRGQVVGRSPYLQPVHFAGDERLVGTILPVTITERHANSLAGAVHPFGEPPAATKECA